MADIKYTTTNDHKPTLVELIRRLPGILAGRLPDEYNIAEGFRTRLGFGILEMILPNFEALGRGEVGVDGTQWKPLSREYLAYGRRFGPGEKSTLLKQAGLNPRVHKHAPNDKKGLLTPLQLKRWRQIFADRYAWFVMRESDASAKAHAAAIAWIIVKEEGAKTKLEVFGNRKVQMLVDTGRLRGSISPGQLFQAGVEAEYIRPAGIGGQDQEFDISQHDRVIVGTNVEYAGPNHRRRPLWPSSFPEDWWNHILGLCISGLQQVPNLFRRGGPI